MNETDLSQLFKTKTEAVEFSDHLDSVIDKIYEANFNLETALVNEIGSKAKDELLRLIDPAVLGSPAELKKALERIKDRIHSIPVIDLVLPFEPKEHTLDVLSNWFNLNLKKQLLFQIKINPKIIAGLSVNYNGKHFETSIKEKVASLISNLMTKNG